MDLANVVATNKDFLRQALLSDNKTFKKLANLLEEDREHGGKLLAAILTNPDFPLMGEYMLTNLADAAKFVFNLGRSENILPIAVAAFSNSFNKLRALIEMIVLLKTENAYPFMVDDFANFLRHPKVEQLIKVDPKDFLLAFYDDAALANARPRIPLEVRKAYNEKYLPIYTARDRERFDPLRLEANISRAYSMLKRLPGFTDEKLIELIKLWPVERELGDSTFFIPPILDDNTVLAIVQGFFTIDESIDQFVLLQSENYNRFTTGNFNKFAEFVQTLEADDFFIFRDDSGLNVMVDILNESLLDSESLQSMQQFLSYAREKYYLSTELQKGLGPNALHESDVFGYKAFLRLAVNYEEESRTGLKGNAFIDQVANVFEEKIREKEAARQNATVEIDHQLEEKKLKLAPLLEAIDNFTLPARKVTDPGADLPIQKRPDELQP